MSYDEDVNKLIQAALDQCESLPMHTVYALEKALEPFREPRPHTGHLIRDGKSIKAIELTDAVRKALKDAGVEVDDELAD